MSSSTQTTETRRGSAIVFDPEKETVSTSKVKKIEGMSISASDFGLPADGNLL